MRKFVFGGVVLAALFAAVPANAQPPIVTTSAPQAGHTRHSFFTSNQNRADVPARIAKMFNQLDLNRDGFVTKDEIATLRARFDDRQAKTGPMRLARMFDRMDTNRDGRVTVAEVDAARAAKAAAKGKTVRSGRPPALFARADANKDGVVTRAEFEAAAESGRIKLRHAAMRGGAIVRLFDSADTNKDGRLSLEEAEQAGLRQFDAADLDHDGVVTPVERRQAVTIERQNRRAG